MKRNLKLGLFGGFIVILILVAIALSLSLNSTSTRSKSSGNDVFDEDKAISMVIKDHPDFPANPSDTITKKLPTGGPQGSTANVRFTTQSQKTGENAYTVTLAKDWGITVNGKYARSFWKYNVTPDGVNLLESIDNDMLPNIMK